MIEAAFVFGTDGALLWHLPEGRSAGYIPDVRQFFNYLQTNRELVVGIAHLHPFEGQAHPSREDLTTFFALDNGLGKKHIWPIYTLTSEISLVKVVGDPQGGGTYYPVLSDQGETVGYYKVVPAPGGLAEAREHLRDIGRKGI